MQKDYLQIKNLNIRYYSNNETVNAVNGIDLELKDGETLGLVGETGAGKTTTALSIMGLLPPKVSEIVSGSIVLDGEELVKSPEKKMRLIRGRKVAMIFQDPMTSLNPLQTVGEQIGEMILLHNHFSKQELSNQVDELMEKVGLPKGRKTEYPHQFSGGMKQRVVIAIALACNPKLLIADEPTTALDVTIQAQILNLMEDLKREYHTSMLLITHDLGVVAETSDRVAVIYAGEILEYGSREDIFLHPSHPYTVGLFHSLPGMNSQARRLKPITGSPPDPTDLPEGCAFAPRCPHAKGGCSKGKIEFREIAPGHFCRCGLKQKED